MTFVFAGLQKLADRWFFKASAPSSLQSQLHAAARHSPIGGLAGSLAHGALVVGLLIAFGELAVGLGTLLGLWTRWAAAAGLLFNAGFLLTVSWHARPYYYGADIVFMFAWTPLILAGAGRWSLDAWTTSEARRELKLPEPQPVTVGFETVQRLCGQYDKGRCQAQHGQRCRPLGCPVLTDRHLEALQPEINRRAFLQQAGLAGWLASAAVLAGGAAAVLGRLLPPRASAVPAPALGASAAPPGSTAPPTTTPGSTAPPATAGPAAAPPSDTDTTVPGQVPTTQLHTPTTVGGAAPGTRIGPAADVPVGGAASFTDPGTGDPAFVVQPTAGRFVAFDAICTHQGCTVEYAGSVFQCPCHGAQFDAHTGQVVQGPARLPLPAIHIQKGGDGNLYVT